MGGPSSTFPETVAAGDAKESLCSDRLNQDELRISNKNGNRRTMKPHPKKVWVKPVLTILIRCQAAESVLVGCKFFGQDKVAPGNSFLSCRTACTPCSQDVAS